jgi:autotransporter-associated beta strand protein
MNNNQVMAMLALAASVALATDYTWNQNSGTNSFQTSSYWTPTGLPGAADKASFTAAGTYGVTFADHVTNANASVGAGADVTFDLGGYSWRLTNASPLVFSGAAVARYGGGTLEMTKTNSASFTGPNPNPGSSQKLILNSGTSTFRGSIGTGAGGTLEINGGTHSLMSGLNLSTAPAGGVSFRMTGGTATVENISYTDARTVLNNSFSAKMSLEGGSFVMKNTMDVYGGGVIDVYSNAIFTTSAALNLARSSGYQGSMNIYGGTVSNTGIVYVGLTTSTTGRVCLAEGLLYTGSHIYLGFAQDSAGIIQQSGGLFRSAAGALTLGYAIRSLGVYTQEGGVAWCNTISAGTGANASGEIYLKGGTLTTPNALNLGYGSASVGRLAQSGGSLITSNSLFVGSLSGAYGVYSNTGGRAWCNQLRVGYAAGSTGEVFLTGGTLAASGVSGASTVGEVAGASARMFQSGGALIVSNALAVGNAVGAAGSYTNTGGSMWLSGTLIIGNSAGTSGKMLFNGSSLEARGGITVGSYSFATGELALAGGQLPMTNAILMVGSLTGAVGKVEISGGTNLFQTIGIGSSGLALLRVTGGYTHTTNRIIVGLATPSTGRVELVGGILAMPFIDGRAGPAYNNPTGGYAEVLFDGGTLRPATDGNTPASRNAFVSDFSKATLTGRGAVIDTAGETLMIPQVLSNAMGYAGSFTKKGAGKLTLTSGANNFTGRVAVEQGELAVSGNVFLTGGVAISPGALLSISGTVNDALTASGTVSRIDGALALKTGGALTNGLGAVLGGSGVVTGKVVFATGSAWARDKADPDGTLQVTAGAVFQTGVTARLTGYTPQDLAAGIPLVTAGAVGGLQLSGWVPVTLDGISKSTWWATLSADGKTLTARVIPFGTLIRVL